MTIKKALRILNVIAILFALKFGAFLWFWKIPPKFELIAFDVEQGDSLMLTIPNSTIQILIDGGPDDKIVKKLQDTLPAGDNFIDVIILTHAHEDHVAGIPGILENFKVGLVIDSGAKGGGSNYEKMIKQIEALEIPYLYAVRGEVVRIGTDFSLEIIHPFFSAEAKYKNLNNASVSALVSYDSNKIVLVGDLEQEGEKEVLNYLEKNKKLENLSAKILKVGHHGSKTASSDKFLNNY